MTRKQIEKKYGVKIVEEPAFYSGTNKKSYKLFSADGCPWENGLPTIKAVEEECRKWERQLLTIRGLYE